jgi:hypothetical protein
VKRYHEWQSMPGFGIDEISGQKFAKATAEWNLPPIVFESAGWPAFHAAWLRTSAFASALVTDPQQGNLRQRWSNIWRPTATLRSSSRGWWARSRRTSNRSDWCMKTAAPRNPAAHRRTSRSLLLRSTELGWASATAQLRA